MSGIFRVGFLDLEMSNLNADFGFILCGCVKENGGEVHTRRIDQYPIYKKAPWDDSMLCEDLRDLITGFDLIFTWNGARFDIPFLNTRLLKHNLEPLPKKLHKDALYTSRYKLRLHSNRLASVQEFFGLENEKTSISGEYWNMAVTGNREALDYIVDHCERDVLVLEEVVGRLKGFMTEIKA